MRTSTRPAVPVAVLDLVQLLPRAVSLFELEFYAVKHSHRQLTLFLGVQVYSLPPLWRLYETVTLSSVVSSARQTHTFVI